MTSHYLTQFADPDPDLLSPLTLLTRGTRNRKWNEIAIDVFTAKGMTASVTFLKGVERMLNSPVRPSAGFLPRTEPPKRGSWLYHDDDYGLCVDCRKVKTDRRFSGYWQCPHCAETIQAAGGRKQWAFLKAHAEARAA